MKIKASSFIVVYIFLITVLLFSLRSFAGPKNWLDVCVRAHHLEYAGDNLQYAPCKRSHA